MAHVVYNLILRKKNREPCFHSKTVLLVFDILYHFFLYYLIYNFFIFPIKFFHALSRSVTVRAFIAHLLLGSMEKCCLSNHQVLNAARKFIIKKLLYFYSISL